MSICDKCPDDGLSDVCSPVHTFSELVGKNALEKVCKWDFDHPVNEGAVFIVQYSSNYDAHFILSYLITKEEYPGIIISVTSIEYKCHYCFLCNDTRQT